MKAKKIGLTAPIPSLLQGLLHGVPSSRRAAVNQSIDGHIWPETYTVTVFCRIDVVDYHAVMNDEHSDYKWVN